MTDEGHSLGGLTSVEVVQIDVLLGIDTGKQVTTIGETDFITALDWDCMVTIDGIAEHIAHLDLVLESNY